MIWESSYWKRDLLKRASWLRKRTAQKRWLEASHALLEQTVMTGFFSVRKLIDSKKVSNAITEQQVEVTAFPALNKPVTLMNWHKIDQLYDFETGICFSQNLQFFCNQIIHSYVFIPLFGDRDAIEGILFTSDRERSRFLYQIQISKIVGLFEQMAWLMIPDRWIISG